MQKYGILRLTLLLTFAIFVFPCLSAWAAQQRIALVIGNVQYRSAPLNNPLNDAKDIAKALEKYGFKVTHKENVDQRKMEQAIREFGKELRKGGVGLFFFAGHGVQIGGRNYLIPIDATIYKQTDVKYEAVDAGRILDEMAWAGNELNIVILDACRDNPYGSGFRSISRGLARMDAPRGTIIAYSTSPGKVALDGESGNSPYTKALLKYMDVKGLTLEQVFKNVRKEIDFKTKGKQVPWESTSLTGTFYFKKTQLQSPTVKVKPPPAPKPPKKVAARKTGSSSSLKRTSSKRQYNGYFDALARSGLHKAFLYFEKALKSNPGNDEARSGVAIGLVFLGNEEEVDYHLKRLKESSKLSTNMRIAVGFMEGLQGLYMEGFYELKRALEEGGNRALIKLCTAAVAERNGDEQQASQALAEYRSLVPSNDRNTFYEKLARRLEIHSKLLGSYYVTGTKKRGNYAFGIVFTMIDGALAASIIQDDNFDYYTLQRVSFENGKLLFAMKEQFRGLWTINEYEAEPTNDFEKIPLRVRQVEGNCGKNGATAQAFMVRAPESTRQSRSIAFAPSGVPLAHAGGCFVATAAFGSPFEEHVNTLRRFRDRIMLKCAIGKSLCDVYYRYGPVLAKAIEKRSWARAIVRFALTPLVILAGMALGNPKDCITFSLILVLITFNYYLLRTRAEITSQN